MGLSHLSVEIKKVCAVDADGESLQTPLAPDGAVAALLWPRIQIQVYSQDRKPQDHHVIVPWEPS